MAMVHSIVGVLLFLMLFLILILVLLVCKPWRFFISATSRTAKIGELERALVSDAEYLNGERITESARNYDIEGAYFQNDGIFNAPTPQSHGLIYKHRLSAMPSQGDSLVLKVSSNPSGDILVGDTLKRPSARSHANGVQNHDRLEDQIHDLKFGLENGSYLYLDVVSGPCQGKCCSVQSLNASGLPLTIGRVSPSDLLLTDSEVSGKHAMISWNSHKSKWELVDMGSLNGTFLNSKPINHRSSGSRQWGNPVELQSGDTITVGTISNVYVHIASQSECQIPFRIGTASDAMALRQGGKKFPMEDVCYYHWPLPGVSEFGIFGICDGHGGAEAAKSASRILPAIITRLLSDSLKRDKVLSQCDASEVLRDAFSQTEVCMDHHHYEGCTATVLLVWAGGDEKFFLQCANVGDSACVVNVFGEQINMTEDHRITSTSERLRINEMGEPLRDGETRLCGLNLGRMLGDKFLKEQESRFSSEPFISQAVHIDQSSSAFALLASDGFWDVISIKKSIQLVVQKKESYSKEDVYSAEKIANFLLSEARKLRTKDNTSIIILDFEKKSGLSSCKADC